MNAKASMPEPTFHEQGHDSLAAAKSERRFYLLSTVLEQVPRKPSWKQRIKYLRDRWFE